MCYRITVNRKNGKGVKPEPLLLKDGRPVARGVESIIGYMIGCPLPPSRIMFTGVDNPMKKEITGVYKIANGMVPVGSRDIPSFIPKAIEEYESGFRMYPTEPETGYDRLL